MQELFLRACTDEMPCIWEGVSQMWKNKPLPKQMQTEERAASAKFREWRVRSGNAHNSEQRRQQAPCHDYAGCWQKLRANQIPNRQWSWLLCAATWRVRTSYWIWIPAEKVKPTIVTYVGTREKALGQWKAFCCQERRQTLTRVQCSSGHVYTDT